MLSCLFPCLPDDIHIVEYQETIDCDGIYQTNRVTIYEGKGYVTQNNGATVEKMKITDVGYSTLKLLLEPNENVSINHRIRWHNKIYKINSVFTKKDMSGRNFYTEIIMSGDE